MTQLPETYEAYLSDKNEDVVATVKPILLQSASDQLHGVRVLLLPNGGLQAHLDDKVPYGTVFEDID